MERLYELDTVGGVDAGLRELALFAGAGGGILGGKLLGWRTVCAVERDPYAASVLVARQNDGFLPPFPIWDDVCTFDGRPWRGHVDVVSGGFPCQDISVAGRGAGISGARSGLWKEFARIIGEVRPRYVFVENSPALTTRGLGTVLGDVAALGFDAEWGVLGADDAGAPHKRDRIWIVAHADGQWQLQSSGSQRNERGWFSNSSKDMADTAGQRRERPWQQEQWISSEADCQRQANHVESDSLGDFWRIEPNVGRVAHGVAARMDRLRAIGNGQVPQCAALAWRVLTERLAK